MQESISEESGVPTILLSPNGWSRGWGWLYSLGRHNRQLDQRFLLLKETYFLCVCVLACTVCYVHTVSPEAVRSAGTGVVMSGGSRTWKTSKFSELLSHHSGPGPEDLIIRSDAITQSSWRTAASSVFSIPVSHLREVLGKEGLGRLCCSLAVWSDRFT